ncbi:hypothetical protein EVAR_30043_1 [Eumeta japonica]|uniref:Uncharacterized protein n=1 Tax=Eumeta variegata TaxID=151549 RepID=A0A4C1VV40_EUMVA|nr:hypothetical protein EVAR_30043_1 [Eumeta japonica]
MYHLIPDRLTLVLRNDRSLTGMVLLATLSSVCSTSMVNNSSKLCSVSAKHVLWTCSMQGEKEQKRPPEHHMLATSAEMLRGGGAVELFDTSQGRSTSPLHNPNKTWTVPLHNARAHLNPKRIGSPCYWTL